MTWLTLSTMLIGITIATPSYAQKRGAPAGRSTAIKAGAGKFSASSRSATGNVDRQPSSKLNGRMRLTKKPVAKPAPATRSIQDATTKQKRSTRSIARDLGITVFAGTAAYLSAVVAGDFAAVEGGRYLSESIGMLFFSASSIVTGLTAVIGGLKTGIGIADSVKQARP